MTLPLYKTQSVKSRNIQTAWWIVDATNQVVGRLASQIAIYIMGKHRAYYTPHLNCGDKVTIINAEKVCFTGEKMDTKNYVSYTGYPGGQRKSTPKNLLNKKPTDIIRHALKGMLPKNKLGRKLLKNVYIYKGNQHPHLAQKPSKLPL